MTTLTGDSSTHSEEATRSSSPSSVDAPPASPPPLDRAALGRLLRPIRGALIAAGAVQAVAAAASLVPFLAVAELGRVLLGPDPDPSRVWGILFLAAGGLIVRVAAMFLATGITHFADNALQLDIRRRLADQLRRVPLGWFTDRTSGEVKKAVQDDVAAMHHLVAHALTDLVAGIVTPLLALAYLLSVDWRLTLITLATLPVFVGVYALTMRGFSAKMAEYNRSLERVNAAIVEFVHGIAVIKTFGQARKAHARFIGATDAYADYFSAWARSIIRPSALAEIVVSPAVVLLVVLVGGTAMVGAGAIEPADVLWFLLLGVGLTAPILTLQYTSHELRLAREAAGRVAALLDIEPLPVAESPGTPEGSRVVYHSVSFSYEDLPGDRALALRGVNLILEPGTVTALVGPSGSGKSTIARLLPRFYDPCAGSVSLGGVDVRDIEPAALYRAVGFVFQDVQLLGTTLRQNIALGRPEASEAEIESAARAAQIHERILELPRGYDSVVGEDAQLSGGEAQRVSIARALLADPGVLVLDEATAFADPESEAAIQDALSELAVGRTVLVVAHRLSTITGVDQIAVVDNGQIVESGRHPDLLAAGGLYARLWQAHERAGARIQEVSS